MSDENTPVPDNEEPLCEGTYSTFEPTIIIIDALQELLDELGEGSRTPTIFALLFHAVKLARSGRSRNEEQQRRFIEIILNRVFSETRIE